MSANCRDASQPICLRYTKWDAPPLPLSEVMEAWRGTDSPQAAQLIGDRTKSHSHVP